MNVRMKMDTTMLQSNTACELIKFITEQHVLIRKFIEGDKIIGKEVDTVIENYETIGILHQRALHKRLGRILKQ